MHTFQTIKAPTVKPARLTVNPKKDEIRPLHIVAARRVDQKYFSKTMTT
jgi:hypothetical protein